MGIIAAPFFLIGLLIGLIVLAVSFVFICRYKKKTGKGSILGFIILASLGVYFWWKTSIAYADSNFTPGSIHSSMMFDMFLVGLSPSGAVFGLMAVFVNKK